MNHPHIVVSPLLRRAGLVLLASAALLTWLFIHAEAVLPEQHFVYTQHLRDLRELDAQIDSELLANRLELSRNYDALTTYVLREDAAADKLTTPPAYLPAADRAAVIEAATALHQTLEQKSRLIDLFKRNNAVLRNSLAYFPSAADLVVDQNLVLAGPSALSSATGRYARQVLAFARAPEAVALPRIAQARERLQAQALHSPQRQDIENLLRHGQTIVERLPELDRQTRDILALQSANRLETLNHAYSAGYGRAQAHADRYREALYTVAILLAGFLAYIFLRLEQTRRSLAQAHHTLSERYAAQLLTEQQLKLHAEVFHNAHDGITLTDASGNILDVNPAFTRISGYERSEAIGRNPRVLKSGRHDRAFYQAMWKSIADTGQWQGEIWNRNKFGEIYPELLSISAVRNAVGETTNYVAIFSDISRIKAQERQLKQMAYYDALTELPNRVLLADRLIQAISHTRRSATLMAICYLDLDGFKPVNDQWGHDVGDKVLVEVAGRLRDALRGGDTVARLGGDEFVLLLLGLENEAECHGALQRVQSAVLQAITVTPEPVTLSASIGVTLYPDDPSDPDSLLRHADQAMYRAKQMGKNCVRFFDAEADRSARSRHDHIARIQQALENDELRLFYQPSVNMRSGTVVGAEALLRWQHPERGLLLPGEFLPLIEDDDLICAIGHWALRTALAQIDAWRQAGLDLVISVNVAGRQFQDPDFVQQLVEALAAYPGIARHLMLEVLETSALEDMVKVSQVIEACRDIGVGFALDDFGTGYSSLTYLKRLPAGTIKIDASFVKEVLNDYNNLIIVQGVIGLAQAFQRKLIAEGVESVEHGRLLLQLDCEHAQGFGIARPMPAEAFTDWIAEWQPAARWQEVAGLQWQAADYPLLHAEVELRNWVGQIVYAASEGNPLPVASRQSPACGRFGDWYRGDGAERYETQPFFADMAFPLSELHAIALDIDEHWRSGRLEAARLMLPQLLENRDRLLGLLHRLQLAVGTPR